MRPGQLVHGEDVLAGHSAVEDRRSLTDIPSMRPLIGVTTSEVRRGDLATLRRHGEPPQHEMALGLTYMRADRAGRRRARRAAAARAGRDGDAAHAPRRRLPLGRPGSRPRRLRRPRPRGARPDRAGARPLRARARARGRRRSGCRCSAICRGAQALNIARGGTLHQHIDGHRQSELATLPTHSVRIAARSRAARLLGARAAEVNSFHHQAVDSLGDGLVATAWAPDGTIEGIEDPRAPVPARRAVARRDADSTSPGSSRCSPRSSRPPPRTARRPLAAAPVPWLREHRRHRRADRHRRQAPRAARAGAERARRGRPRPRGRVPLVGHARARPEPHADRRRGARGRCARTRASSSPTRRRAATCSRAASTSTRSSAAASRSAGSSARASSCASPATRWRSSPSEGSCAGSSTVAACAPTSSPGGEIAVGDPVRAT